MIYAGCLSFSNVRATYDGVSVVCVSVSTAPYVRCLRILDARGQQRLSRVFRASDVQGRGKYLGRKFY